MVAFFLQTKAFINYIFLHISMFGFLKKKLEEAIGSFSKKAEKEADVVEEKAQEPKEQPSKRTGEKKVSEEKKKPQTKKSDETVEKPAKADKKAEEKAEEAMADEEEASAKKDGVPASEEHDDEIESLPEDKEKSPGKHPLASEDEKRIVEEEEEEEEEVSAESADKEGEEDHKEEADAQKPAETSKADAAAGLKQEKKQEEKKGFFQNLFRKKEEPEKKPAVQEPEKQKQEEKPEPQAKPAAGKADDEEKDEESKGFFGKISDSITKVSLSEQKFDELFWDLEIILLENNVAVEVIEKIKSDLRSELVEKKIARNALDKKVVEALKRSIESLFTVEKIDLIKKIRSKKPYVIVFVGINGTGKTTTLAKLIHKFKENHLDCVVGACDTFRAAAIQQLEEHTNSLGVKLVKHDYGADPAAVAFDALEHAKAKGKDVVMIDTAGRLHSNKNLMQELEKIIRIVKPDMKIFIGESLAGNDVVEQVKLFNESVGIDGIILTKADTDEKGGAAISVSYVTGKPIIYLGTGQKYDDLQEFDSKLLLEQIGLS
jgi:fused signal recognition particle receptor